MPYNLQDPIQVQAFTQHALSQGATQTDVQNFLAQNKAASPQPQSLPQNPADAMSWGGLANNIGSNVGSIVQGIGNIPNQLLNVDHGDFNKFAQDAGVGFVKNLAETAGVGFTDKSGKPSLNWSVDNAIHHAYQKPIDTILNVLPFLGAAKGLTAVGEAGEAAGAAEGADAAGAAGDAAKTGVFSKAGDAIEGVGKNLAVKALKPSPTQVANIEEVTGMPIGDFIEQNKLYGSGKVAAAKADTLIAPLQDTYNSMVRTGKDVSGADYAQALQQRALDILSKDHSSAARSVADGLWKEADAQEKMGNITDTILTNSKTSSFNKVPGNVMQDSATYNVNKEVANVGRNLLDQIAPGSADIGKQLQGLQEFKKIALKQGGLGQGSNVLGIMKPTGSGAMVGGMIGGPAGAVAGAGIGYLSTNPTVLEGLSQGAQGLGDVARAIPGSTSLLKGIAPAGSAVSNLAPVDEANNNDNQQNDSHILSPGATPNNTSMSGQVSQTGSLGSVPPTLGGSQQNSSVSEQNNPAWPQFQNPYGASPKELLSASISAYSAGDMRNYKLLYGLYQSEQSYQQLAHPKLGARAAMNLSNSQTAISTVGHLADTISTYKDVMGPLAGRVSGLGGFNDKANLFESQMDTTAQLIANSTGGDAKQVRQMLPQITDPISRAKSKLSTLQNVLQTQYQTRFDFLKNAAAGSDVGATATGE